MIVNQKITGNVGSQLNALAVKNVEIANTLVNVSKSITGVNKSALQNAASVAVNAANVVVKNASDAKAAVQVVNAVVSAGKNAGSSALNITNNMAVKGLNTANSANTGIVGAKVVANATINATGKVTNNSNVAAGVSKVNKAATNSAKNVEIKAINNSVKANTKAANSALKLVNKVNDPKAQVALVNAAGKIQNNTKNMLNRVQPTNSSSTSYGKVKSAGKGFLLTSTGNTVKQSPQNVEKMVNPKNSRVYVKFNGKNKKLTTQVYKQGGLKNVYKNKKGVYTKANGMSGNVKNYLYSGMNTGLFQNKMM